MSTHNIWFCGEIRKISTFFGFKIMCLICCYELLSDQGPVIQCIICLTSPLMTNLLTVADKVFLNTLIFLPQKCE